jgi:hypothetical protein
MLESVAIALVLLWLLGWVSSVTMGADPSVAGHRLGGGPGACHPRQKTLTVSTPPTGHHKKACTTPSGAG